MMNMQYATAPYVNKHLSKKTNKLRCIHQFLFSCIRNGPFFRIIISQYVHLRFLPYELLVCYNDYASQFSTGTGQITSLHLYVHWWFNTPTGRIFLWFNWTNFQIALNFYLKSHPFENASLAPCSFLIHNIMLQAFPWVIFL